MSSAAVSEVSTTVVVDVQDVVRGEVKYMDIAAGGMTEEMRGMTRAAGNE